jgi:hypothetical protein
MERHEPLHAVFMLDVDCSFCCCYIVMCACLKLYVCMSKFSNDRRQAELVTFKSLSLVQAGAIVRTAMQSAFLQLLPKISCFHVVSGASF